MPVPMTRPIMSTQAEHFPGAIERRGDAPTLSVPPSVGTVVPGWPTPIHTVTDPAKVAPTIGYRPAGPGKLKRG